MSHRLAVDLRRRQRSISGRAGHLAGQGSPHANGDTTSATTSASPRRVPTPSACSPIFIPGIDQIWIPEMGVVDRCTTCHQGITQPSLLDAVRAAAFPRTSADPSPRAGWGCTVCHRGQGPATEVAEAHETTLAWEQPLLPDPFHPGVLRHLPPRRLAGNPADSIVAGQLLAQLNCVGCHRLQDIERPAMLGPDLTNVGNKGQPRNGFTSG